MRVLRSPGRLNLSLYDLDYDRFSGVRKPNGTAIEPLFWRAVGRGRRGGLHSYFLPFLAWPGGVPPWPGGVAVDVPVDAPSGVVVVELRVVVGVVVELVVGVLVEVDVLLVVGVEELVLVLAVVELGGGVVDTWVVGGVECDELELDLPESPLVTA